MNALADDILPPAGEGVVNYLGVVRRRFWHLLVPFAAGSMLSLILALYPTAIYESTATILIEQQDIPEDLVRSTVRSYADEQLQFLQRRVTSSANLARLVDQYGLYPGLRSSAPLSEVIERFRADIQLQTISADLRDRQGGQAREATIAFSVLYRNADPQTAQRVTNELITLYLSEHARQRTASATETSSFLDAEAQRLSQEIQSLEGKLAQFKQVNMGALPDQGAANLQLLDRAESALSDSRRQIELLEERRVYLDSQLAQLEASPGTTDAMNPRQKLQALRLELVTLSARYGATHPDVVRTRRQVEALEHDLGGGGALGGSAGAELLAQRRAALEQARQNYAPEHPDVQALAREVQALEVAAGTAAAGDDSAMQGNSAYVQLKAQKAAIELELASLRSQTDKLQTRRTDLEARLAKTPEIERAYRQLVRDYDYTTARYQETRTKQMEAQLAADMERSHKGERFSLIEPPQLPVAPSYPNRQMILLVGMMLALGAGAGIAFTAEMLDPRLYGAAQAAALTGAAPLVVVPVIRTRADRGRRRRIRIRAAAAGIVAMLMALVVLHFAVAPLGQLWSIAGTRLGAL